MILTRCGVYVGGAPMAAVRGSLSPRAFARIPIMYLYATASKEQANARKKC